MKYDLPQKNKPASDNVETASSGKKLHAIGFGQKKIDGTVFLIDTLSRLLPNGGWTTSMEVLRRVADFAVQRAEGNCSKRRQTGATDHGEEAVTEDWAAISGRISAALKHKIGSKDEEEESVEAATEPVSEHLYVYVTNPIWSSFFWKEYCRKYEPKCPLPDNPSPSMLAHDPPENIESTKWMMHWVWKLSRHRARMVLRGLCRAGGSWSASARQKGGDCENLRDSGDGVVFTASSRFRDEIVQLCLHAGYTVSVTLEQRAHEERDTTAPAAVRALHPLYRIHFSDDPSVDRPVLVQATDVQKVPYSGVTWCVSVPEPHLIFVRRAERSLSGEITQVSRPIVVGNCFNQLDLPQYESFEKLRDSLLLAIREGCEGFGFG